MRNKNTLSFGFLGLGNIVRLRVSDIFLKEIDKKKAKVVAVYDKNITKNIEFSKKFNCSISKTENDFFDKKFKICYISTESGSHFKNIIKCFKKNKHVIVEKPPVLKTNQLIFLNKLANKKKLNLFVIYQNRENKSVQFVKNFIRNNREKIVFVNLKLLWSRPQKYYTNWHGKWKTDGGVLAQQGIHYIDLLCYLFGKPLKAIGKMTNISNKLEAEDTHIGIVNFKKANCTFNLTTALRPQDHTSSIEIYYKTKMIKLSGLCCNEVSVVSYDGQKKTFYKKLSKRFSEKVKNGIGISHLYFFQKVTNFFLRKKSSEPLKAIDTLDTLKLINMIYKSTEVNGWVKNSSSNIISRLGN